MLYLTLTIKIVIQVKLEEVDGWVKDLHVRGVVMNPVDHPHGGGEGRTLEEEILLHLGGFQPKAKELEIIKEQISLFLKRRNSR